MSESKMSYNTYYCWLEHWKRGIHIWLNRNEKDIAFLESNLRTFIKNGVTHWLAREG